MPTFYSWKQFDIIKDIIKKQGNLLRGIDNFSGVWYKGLKVPWTLQDSETIFHYFNLKKQHFLQKMFDIGAIQ